MVGIFSRFSGSKSTGHRRAQSAVGFVDQDQREVLPQNEEVVGVTATSAAAHGIAVAVEFKPVEHPSEPIDNDPPVRCPLPEPSILNDGRIWKERMSATVQRTPDLPVPKDGESPETVSNGTRPRRSILPSLSAPEHNLINLLDECNAAGI
ncbi:hypothetical protein AQUCO_00500587v1 [Aquilegia coerulea]|uniref:Cystic fibrosis transmembrane conductance regulator n=1 Tax=Aquilegia coerulea TaxID=218851 RepID=A0A2G5ESN5_AQUCA|nr:hypothetical protein AQUCO_00500587v1 [Aquilegia coerulea]